MNDCTEPVTPTADDADRLPMPMRVFNVEYTSGKNKTFSSHLYDTMNGNLVFIDCVRVGNKDRLYHRRTIAAGQWREITEVTGGTISERVN